MTYSLTGKLREPTPKSSSRYVAHFRSQGAQHTPTSFDMVDVSDNGVLTYVRGFGEVFLVGPQPGIQEVFTIRQEIRPLVPEVIAR